MNILIIMVPLALLLGMSFVFAFIWASSKGQFDDLVTPALRILKDETNKINTNLNLNPERNSSDSDKRKV